jgi:hypothetical protein
MFGRWTAVDQSGAGCSFLAEACNTGLEPVVRRGSNALARDRLSWIRPVRERAAG